MFKYIYFVVVALVLVVSGCSSDGDKRRQEYLDADYYTRLEIPPDLTSNVGKEQLNAPRPTDRAVEKFKEDTRHLGTDESKKSTGVCP